MNTLLTANLSTKVANDGDSPWAPPTFTFGETLTLALRFTKSVDGQLIEPALDIAGMTAAIGYVDARPLSGTFALQIGAGAQTADNTTDALPYDCTPGALKAAIAAKAAVVTAYGTPSVTKEEGSWMITFGTGAAEVPLTVRDNKLWPVSLGRISAAPLDAVWIHEVRMIQVPGAFTDTSERVLPDPPSISEVTMGGGGGGYSWNEIQALYIPPNFRGTFSLKSGFARTGQLSVSDLAETIQAALAAVLGDNFLVTNPAPYTAHIEWINDLKGVAIDLLEVIPLDPPPGDLTFSLALDRAPMLAWLRNLPEVTLPLELRLRTTDADDVESEQVAFRTDVTIQRPLIFPELATTPETDWLRPPSPHNYVPFNPDTVITGQQFYPAVIGNGSATAFTIAHGLATDAVWVWVRENVSNGRQLVDGTDYRVRVVNASSVSVTALTGAPALNAWLATVVSAQTVGAFADYLAVTIGQVTGLGDRLEGLETALAEVLALIPTTPIGTTTGTAGDPIVIEIPDYSDLFPGHSGAVNLAELPRPGGLLPAIHDASATSITTVLPALSGSAGNVYSNGTAAALFLPGGLGMRSSYVAIAGFLGSDGRRFYPLSRSGTSTSYYPRDFERELCMFEVNSAMLRAGTTLTLDVPLALQLFGATSRCQYNLVIEHGTAPSQTSPATTAPNLQDITWNATPLLKQRVILGPNKVAHRFGIQLIRASNGVLSANKVVYGFATAADSVPASADCAIRVRLIDFDTENSVDSAKGTVYFALQSAIAQIR